MGRIPKTRKMVRLSLEMDPNVRQVLERLRDDTMADSLAEVIRRSLGVYRRIWSEHQGGAKIIIRRDGNETELLIV